MALKLCPKTCGMCGFSLMSPVHIKPPVHNATQATCEDNPMAKCDTLKQFICGNAQASQLCPKTCNLCSAKSTIGVTIMMSATRTISTLTPTIRQAYSTIGVRNMTSTTTISTPLPTITQDICVDSVHISCNDPDIATLICIDVPAATNFCRKTCNLCGTAVVKMAKDQCGDPINESMCQQLHEEVCLCNDRIIASVLCPHYCANQCGPVNRNVFSTDPEIIGRR